MPGRRKHGARRAPALLSARETGARQTKMLGAVHPASPAAGDGVLAAKGVRSVGVASHPSPRCARVVPRPRPARQRKTPPRHPAAGVRRGSRVASRRLLPVLDRLPGVPLAGPGTSSQAAGPCQRKKPPPKPSAVATRRGHRKAPRQRGWLQCLGPPSSGGIGRVLGCRELEQLPDRRLYFSMMLLKRQTLAKLRARAACG